MNPRLLRIYSFWIFWVGTILLPPAMYFFPGIGWLFILFLPALCFASAACATSLPHLARIGMGTLVLGQSAIPLLLFLANR